jgi:hypothetical protein
VLQGNGKRHGGVARGVRKIASGFRRVNEDFS